ncbi:PepSY domain-containing protein [Sphingobium aromaticivastans]|uniref:PepSY domain-containing protein n=2 Tax=Sphingobium TaxID=165695 RepID=UPI00159C9DEF
MVMKAKQNPAVAGQLWVQIHRYLGLASLFFLGLAALTGCLLCFNQPLDEMLNADLFARAAPAARPVDPLIAADRFARTHPALQLTSVPVIVPADRNIPVSVAAAPGKPAPEQDQLFLDRESGDPIGGRSTAPGWDRRQFTAGLLDLHYRLLAGDWGRWLMGVVALAWLISNFVGFYLTFPRKRPFFANWKRMWRFSFRSMFGRLMLDLHRASGLWLLIGITLLALTSVAFNFYDEAYAPMATKIAPLKRPLFDQPAPFPDGARPTLHYTDALRLARVQAAKDGLDWRPATALYRPDWNFYGVTFTDNGITNYHRLGPVYYYFDARTGALAHEVNPYDDSAGLVMLRILYPVHSGKVAGNVTIAIIFLLGLATLEMCVTGFYVWWKKRASRVAMAKAQARAAQAQAARARIEQ